PEQMDKCKSLPTSDAEASSSTRQGEVLDCIGESRFPCKNFISLLGQDLLPVNTFTQTFLQSILLSVDSTDPVVANAWMETLLDVIDLLPKEVIKGEILSLAVNKGQMSQPVPSRLLCCKLLGKMCEKFDAYVIKKEVLPVVLSLCQDVDFEVRGSMCERLDIIAQGLGLETTKNSILPELVELANDEENFVRLTAIETVVRMVPFLDDDTCTQIIIPLMKKFCENALQLKDSTLPVITKQSGQLCHGLWANFSQEQKDWFLGFFRGSAKLGLSSQEANTDFTPMPDLLPEVDHKDRYRECRSACAYNFPAMVLFVGAESFEKELYPCFKELCADPFPNVRRTMACSFYEICRLLGPSSSLLHSELVLLLRDDSIEVLKGLVPRLMEILKAVCVDSDFKDLREKELVKALLACEERTSVTTNWRLHADFLSRLSCLPSSLSSEVVFTTFVPLLLLKMHTARPVPCRTAAVYSLLVILRHTPSLERRKGIINELIGELCYAKSCHKRMLFIRVCELVMELFSKIFFKIHFFLPLLDLSADPVPNIRLRLCSVLPSLKGLLQLPKDGSLLQQLESCIKKLMTGEKDLDVIFAVREAIEKLDKIEVATDVISKRSSCFEIALDRKDRLKEDEERRQLEKEFSSKLLKTNGVSKPSTGTSGKGGKIPILKILNASSSRESTSSSTHTWPRQKRSTVFHEGLSGHLRSATMMLPTCESTKSSRESRREDSSSVDRKPSNTIRRKLCVTPLPSPEIVRKSVAASFVHMESKIPTHFKRKSTKEKTDS
ncbi:serine/threonine-protein phosphatase 4 regulatory subunit 4-like, partial [Uloborus diversus]|uniref:serine/threonine-protein phosphatase 4 regulatory subunit 4-like n=1 Tax=Uloborus diversus TaxID=327109 RepID=UPI00240944CB